MWWCKWYYLVVVVHIPLHCARAAVVELYRQRRDVFLALCDKYLAGKATWFAPTAGMFVWFRVLGVDDTSDMIRTKAVEKKVLLVPGDSFSPDGGKSAYVRAAFSTATEDDMDQAVQRFAQLIADL